MIVEPWGNLVAPKHVETPRQQPAAPVHGLAGQGHFARQIRRIASAKRTRWNPSRPFHSLMLRVSLPRYLRIHPCESTNLPACVYALHGDDAEASYAPFPRRSVGTRMARTNTRIEPISPLRLFRAVHLPSSSSTLWSIFDVVAS